MCWFSWWDTVALRCIFKFLTIIFFANLSLNIPKQRWWGCSLYNRQDGRVWTLFLFRVLHILKKPLTSSIDEIRSTNPLETACLRQGSEECVWFVLIGCWFHWMAVSDSEELCEPCPCLPCESSWGRTTQRDVSRLSLLIKKSSLPSH